MQSNPNRPSSASCRSSRSSAWTSPELAWRRCSASTNKECCATDKGKGQAEWPPQRYVRASPMARSSSSQSSGVGLRRSSLLPDGRRTHARVFDSRKGVARAAVALDAAVLGRPTFLRGSVTWKRVESKHLPALYHSQPDRPVAASPVIHRIMK